jgi:bacterioferritin (cytochrome b1)
MATPAETVIANLQTAMQLEASVAGQYQVDVKTIKRLDVKWVAHLVKKWYGCSEEWLREFIWWTEYLGGSVGYQADQVTENDGVKAVFDTALANETTIIDSFKGFCAQAGEAQEYGVFHRYQHAIIDHQERRGKIMAQLALIKQMGEPSFVGSRLEDNT